MAIKELHWLEIIHTDLKPENICVWYSESLKIKIIDFGTAFEFREKREQLI